MEINLMLAYSLLAIVVAFIMLKVYEKYTNKKLVINIITILKVILISILTFINNVFMFTILRTIFATIIAFVLFKSIYNDKFNKTLYYTLIITVILHVIDLIMSLFLPLGIKNIEILNNNMMFKVGFSLLVNIVFYFVATNKYIIKFFKRFENFSITSKFYYIIGVIGLFTCNFWLFYVGTNTADKLLNGIICFTELVIIILLITAMHNKYEKTISKIKEDQLKQNLDLYAKVAAEYKELKHNLMNDLLIIKTKINKKEQEFINDVINKYKSNYDWVNSLTDIPEGLQGLVFLKKNQAELKHIKFNLEYNVTKKIENYFEINKNFKLYETLGILFDNAIEGAEKSKEKIINIVFCYEKKQLKISILNTFNNEIDLDKIGNKNYSTKNRGSGIGLNYIKNQKNKFKISQCIQGNIFITEILINHK